MRPPPPFPLPSLVPRLSRLFPELIDAILPISIPEGYQGDGRGRDRRDGPPRLRTDHDFFKQLKFKTSANGQIGEEDVKRIFGQAGKVTKGSFEETDRKDAFVLF